MVKKAFILTLLLALLVSTVAVAEVTNRDMQLMGGVVVSNSSDSFFFAPMEAGMTGHWGLYALSKASSGPIVEIPDGYPARLVHATGEKVYFLGYTDAERTIHSLYSVTISSGASKELISDIAVAFVGATADEFLYATSADPCTLRSYSLSSEKEKKIKDMSAYEKSIHDAGVYDKSLYFLTTTKSGTEDAYQYQESSGKATTIDKPNPSVGTSILYEGYRLYTPSNNNSQLYSVKVGGKKGTQLGAMYSVSLSHPRFGQYVYTYDGDNNAIVGLPLDGSAEVKQPLDGNTVVRMVLGGSKDELLLIHDSSILSMPANLGSKSKVIDFDQRTGGQIWSYVAPAGSNAIMVFGYGQDTITYAGNMMPTGVYAYDRSSGELLFGFPEWDPNAEVEVLTERPEQLGAPVQQREEGETYFNFMPAGDEGGDSSDGGDGGEG